jgi:hypothetical protein
MTGNNWVNNVQKFLKQSDAEIEKRERKIKEKKHERECTKSVCRKYENMYTYCVKIYVIYIRNKNTDKKRNEINRYLVTIINVKKIRETRKECK